MLGRMEFQVHWVRVCSGLRNRGKHFSEVAVPIDWTSASIRVSYFISSPTLLVLSVFLSTHSDGCVLQRNLKLPRATSVCSGIRIM